MRVHGGFYSYILLTLYKIIVMGFEMWNVINCCRGFGEMKIFIM